MGDLVSAPRDKPVSAGLPVTIRVQDVRKIRAIVASTSIAVRCQPVPVLWLRSCGTPHPHRAYSQSWGFVLGDNAPSSETPAFPLPRCENGRLTRFGPIVSKCGTLGGKDLTQPDSSGMLAFAPSLSSRSWACRNYWSHSSCLATMRVNFIAKMVDERWESRGFMAMFSSCPARLCLGFSSGEKDKPLRRCTWIFCYLCLM